MLPEQIVVGAIGTLANGSVFPDVAPAQTPAPWVTYQSVGGPGGTNLNGTVLGLRKTRMQITVWASTRLGAALLMEDCYQALVNPNVKAVPQGEPVSLYEDDTLLYGSRLDFSIIY